MSGRLLPIKQLAPTTIVLKFGVDKSPARVTSRRIDKSRLVTE